MEMRYFWVADQVQRNIFKVSWQPGTENLGDYPTKHHPPAHHQRVCPFYLHTSKSSRYLLHAPPPCNL
eukprot:12171033-Ditylum_brightwellii.AAC.1